MREDAPPQRTDSAAFVSNPQRAVRRLVQAGDAAVVPANARAVVQRRLVSVETDEAVIGADPKVAIGRLQHRGDRLRPNDVLRPPAEIRQIGRRATHTSENQEKRGQPASDEKSGGGAQMAGGVKRENSRRGTSRHAGGSGRTAGNRTERSPEATFKSARPPRRLSARQSVAWCSVENRAGASKRTPTDAKATPGPPVPAWHAACSVSEPLTSSRGQPAPRRRPAWARLLRAKIMAGDAGDGFRNRPRDHSCPSVRT
jgi:hypothetical protein